MKKKEMIISLIIILLLGVISIFKQNSNNVEVYEVAGVFEVETTTTSTTKVVVWDNLTEEELTDRLNKNLYDYLSGTGSYFTNYTKKTGLDPYLAVSIVNLETGCKWGCSYLAKHCNNIGGLKGKPSCEGGSYMKFDSLEEGINGYLDIIYYNYYNKGLTTAELMNSKYAEDTAWASKVNKYYETIKQS